MTVGPASAAGWRRFARHCSACCSRLLAGWGPAPAAARHRSSRRRHIGTSATARTSGTSWTSGGRSRDPNRPGGTPVVVFFHGGGFRQGDKIGESPAWLLVRCLESGISVASANYRLSNDAPFPGPDARRRPRHPVPAAARLGVCHRPRPDRGLGELGRSRDRALGRLPRRPRRSRQHRPGTPSVEPPGLHGRRRCPDVLRPALHQASGGRPRARAPRAQAVLRPRRLGPRHGPRHPASSRTPRRSPTPRRTTRRSSSSTPSPTPTYPTTPGRGRASTTRASAPC